MRHLSKVIYVLWSFSDFDIMKNIVKKVIILVDFWLLSRAGTITPHSSYIQKPPTIRVNKKNLSIRLILIVLDYLTLLSDDYFFKTYSKTLLIKVFMLWKMNPGFSLVKKFLQPTNLKQGFS